jgi:hypothetical protein
VLEWLSLGLVAFVWGMNRPAGLQFDNRDRRIRCPKCAWQPSKEDRWSCGPGGCGHVWNTFETLGRCPSCDRFWDDTACLRCGAWSPHEEWYDRGKEEG